MTQDNQNTTVLFRFVRQICTVMGVPVTDAQLQELVNRAIKQTPEDLSEADMQRLAFRVVRYLTQQSGVTLDEERLKTEIRNTRTPFIVGDSTRSTANRQALIADLIQSVGDAQGLELDDDMLARLITYTESGQRPLTQEQFYELATMMTVAQIGYASEELNQRELEKQWRDYQRKHGGGKGCLGRLFSLPSGCTLVVVYIITLGVVAAVMLLALLPLLRNQNEVIPGFSPDLNLEPGSNQLSILMATAMAVAAVIVGLLLFLRQILRSFIGFVVMIVFFVVVGIAAFFVAQSGIIDQILRQLTQT